MRSEPNARTEQHHRLAARAEAASAELNPAVRARPGLAAPARPAAGPPAAEERRPRGWELTLFRHLSYPRPNR